MSRSSATAIARRKTGAASAPTSSPCRPISAALSMRTPNTTAARSIRPPTPISMRSPPAFTARARPAAWAGNPILAHRHRHRRIHLRSTTPRPASCRSFHLIRSKTMADYFTHFSCELDVVTADNAARALELYRQFSDELEIEQQTPGFALVATPTAEQPALLWIYDDNASGDTDHVLAFVSELGPA